MSLKQRLIEAKSAVVVATSGVCEGRRSRRDSRAT